MVKTAESWVRLLLEHATALRESGITRIKAGSYEADLAPPVPDISELELSGDPTYAHESPDPLDDPATYGGAVPTFRRGDTT